MPSADAAAVCVDFGSTFTKAALVDLARGRIVAGASHPTTIGTDVLDGYDACLAELTAQDRRASAAEVLACSSAGGGLRIAVVGNEELVTAEAGRRVALSSGGKVVAVLAGGGVVLPSARPAAPWAARLAEAAPDVVLLTGGTDGGNAEVLLECARTLAAAWHGPTVVAGNVEAQADVAAILGDRPHVLADNVVPRIGVLEPDGARAAIREMFLAHVIGGKHLSARTDFTAMVRGATPDVVLTGVELLARGLDDTRPGAGDVAVVDVGGATTDVHSVVEVDHEVASGLSREVVATIPVTRTVEGDLGMRWSAATTVEAAVALGLPVDDELVDAARRRGDDPGFLPAHAAQHPAGRGAGSDATLRETRFDEQIAALAAGIALRRHAGRARVVLGPDGRVVERTGTDLREIDLLVCSGGVFRNGDEGVAGRVLARVLGGPAGDGEEGWQVPREPRVVVDHDYVLAAAGLLAAEHPEAAYSLVHGLARS